MEGVQGSREPKGEGVPRAAGSWASPEGVQASRELSLTRGSPQLFKGTPSPWAVELEQREAKGRQSKAAGLDQSRESPKERGGGEGVQHRA